MSEGKVYFISCSDPWAVKIGFTCKEPESRLRQLQTGCPSQLTLLGWYPAGRDEERRLHDMLEPFRLSGEWFAIAMELDQTGFSHSVARAFLHATSVGAA